MSDPKHKLPVVANRSLEQRDVLHPLVHELTSAGGMNAETAEKMLALQERWEANEARKAYVSAMARLKAVLPPVVRKDKKNTHHGWTYTTLEAMVSHVTGALSEFGFSMSGDGRMLDNGNVEVTVTITHAQGHHQSMTLDSEPDFGMKTKSSGQYSRNKTQAIMATTTSLRRTCISTMMGLGAADMPDVDDSVQPEDRIDTARNLRVAAALTKYGKTKEEASIHLGRGPGAWTAADLNRLAAWARGVPLEQAEEEMGPAAGWGPDEIKRLDGMAGAKTTESERK